MKRIVTLIAIAIVLNSCKAYEFGSKPGTSGKFKDRQGNHYNHKGTFSF